MCGSSHSEVTSIILSWVLEDEDITNDEVLGLLSVNSHYHSIILPYLYHHVNLQTKRRAIRFLKSVVSYRTSDQVTPRRLTMHVQVIQFSFSLNSIGLHDPIWSLIVGCLPDMHQLESFQMVYRHSDVELFHRFVEHHIIFPPSLHQLVLIPVEEEELEVSIYGLITQAIDEI